MNFLRTHKTVCAGCGKPIKIRGTKDALEKIDNSNLDLFQSKEAQGYKLVKPVKFVPRPNVCPQCFLKSQNAFSKMIGY
jgi:hypothetical protein